MIYYGNEILKRKAILFDLEEHQDQYKLLIDNMFSIMDKFDGVGLAAPQINVSGRCFVWNIGVDRGAVFNPWFDLPIEGTVIESTEGCLSAPGHQVTMQRLNELKLHGWDENFNPLEIDATGDLAVVFQHEMDHLDGICIIDSCNRQRRRQIARECSKLRE